MKNKFKKRFNFNLQYPKPLEENELEGLLEVAKSGLLSRYTSNVVNELEDELAEYYEMQYAVTCTSGTAALHGSLVALDFPPGYLSGVLRDLVDINITISCLPNNIIIRINFSRSTIRTI